MTPDERWLAATWPFVREHLPSPPGPILEIGCGTLGGFVPLLRAHGYAAVGIDPQAPPGPDYHQTVFEQYTPAEPVAGVIACTSLHHVTGLDDVLDRMAAAVTPGGVAVVVEWARERFDDATARWCFARLPAGGDGWLDRHRDAWQESGRPWADYTRTWSQDDHLQTGQDIMRGLRARFGTCLVEEAPYFFCDLDGVTAADEQAAIDSGDIQANGIRYIGRKPVT